MKICVAQTRPAKGDIQANIEGHKKLIDLAIRNGADTIIFPELSLTGYEPELANELAVEPGDRRFEDFQKISDTRKITIGVGMPLKSASGICIAMLIFSAGKRIQIYAKKYLHADEKPFFVSGQNPVDFIGEEPEIALAICYELSVPEHSQNAFEKGARVYAASVAKSATGVAKASETLSAIAIKYSMWVLMSNSVGNCDNFESAGKTAAWNNKGVLLAQLSDSDEGIIILNTDTEEVIEKTM